MSTRSKHIIAALFLVAAVVALRLLPIYGSTDLVTAMANLAPLAALALCGGMLLPRKMAIGVTFGAFLLSDIALNLHYGQKVLNAYSAILLLTYAAVFFVGWRARSRKRSLGLALGGTLAGVALFYIVSNTAAFFFDPGYAKTFGGWMQALTVGLPGFIPTWALGLRMVGSNLLFALAFYFATRPASRPAESLAPAPAA